MEISSAASTSPSCEGVMSATQITRIFILVCSTGRELSSALQKNSLTPMTVELAQQKCPRSNNPGLFNSFSLRCSTCFSKQGHLVNLFFKRAFKSRDLDHDLVVLLLELVSECLHLGCAGRCRPVVKHSFRPFSRASGSLPSPGLPGRRPRRIVK
eukprot:1193336-Prorocentrum_minimum.AAC.1